MSRDKSVLFEHINSLLQNFCEKSSGCNGHPIADFDQLVNDKVASPGNHFSYIRSAESLKNLEQRIVELEGQHDQMLYFIHHLYKNFTALISEILSDKNDTSDSTQSARKNLSLLKSDGDNSPCLTRREKEILDLLVKGLCAKEIASELYISETTVITHKKNLKRKFNAKNSVELISKAFMILFECGK